MVCLVRRFSDGSMSFLPSRALLGSCFFVMVSAGAGFFPASVLLLLSLLLLLMATAACPVIAIGTVFHSSVVKVFVVVVIAVVGGGGCDVVRGVLPLGVWGRVGMCVRWVVRLLLLPLPVELVKGICCFEWVLHVPVWMTCCTTSALLLPTTSLCCLSGSGIELGRPWVVSGMFFPLKRIPFGTARMPCQGTF